MMSKSQEKELNRLISKETARVESQLVKERKEARKFIKENYLNSYKSSMIKEIAAIYNTR